MTDKEFRKLSRAELIEIIYELQRREEKAKKTIEELNQKLEEKEICLAEAGSIAEAALKLNQVFEAAQAAADLRKFHGTVAARRADRRLRQNQSF